MEVRSEKGTQIYIPVKNYHAIHTGHWEVECCTVILFLSSNKTIRTFTSCGITQIVTQKGA